MFKQIKLSGSVLVFLGAVFWSLNSPLVKYLTLNAFLICGLRSVIAAAALSPMIRPRQLNWEVKLEKFFGGVNRKENEPQNPEQA